MNCADLFPISTIVKIEGKLRNDTPLRVGYGKTQDFRETTDNPIIKRDGRPIIPGSTLKGAFRSLVESYVKSLNDSRYIVCDITAEDCKSCTKDGKYCIPCILFGYKDLASRVYILDSIAQKFSISQRTMVAINRVFGGQMPGHLYTLDFVEPNAEFSFTMYIYNLNIIDGEKEEWKAKCVEALKYLLRFLTREGIFIGARKSVGFGLVRLIEATATLYEAPNLTNPKVTKRLEEVLS